MYPLREPELTFHDVGHHWRRDFRNPTKPGDVHGDLFRGFWRGELPLRSLSNNMLPVDRRTALAALRELTARAEADPLTTLDPAGFLFLAFWSEDEEGELGPRQAQSASGGVLAEDQRIRIHLPQDRAAWTPAIVDAALKAVALVGFEGLPLSFRRKVGALWVCREEFAAFCSLRDYAAPGWWRAPSVEHAMPALRAEQVPPPARLVDLIAASDERLVAEMHEQIRRSPVWLSPWMTSEELAKRALGQGSYDSKRRRLTQKYKNKYPRV